MFNLPGRIGHLTLGLSGALVFNNQLCNFGSLQGKRAIETTICTIECEVLFKNWDTQAILAIGTLTLVVVSAMLGLCWLIVSGIAAEAPTIRAKNST